MLFHLLTNLVNNLIRNIYIFGFFREYNLIRVEMKKYLLLIEDEGLWGKFKESIEKDINTEIIALIEKKIKEKKSGK